MIKKKLYRYLGRNGIITTPIELIGIDHIDMYLIEASAGCLLTNEEETVFSKTIFAEELDQWKEIPIPL